MHQDFKIRRVVPNDIEYILKTWGREMEKTQPRYPDGRPAFPKRLFFDQFQVVMHALMQRAECRVAIPCSDVSFIANFVVANPIPHANTMVVHFAYTRPPFRRLGLATECLVDMGYKAGNEIVATHWSKYLNRIQRDDLIYDNLVLYHV